MKLLFCFLFSWFTLLVITYCWTAIELTDDPEEHDGNCYSQNEDVGILKVGEAKKLNDSCIQVTCGKDSTLKKGVVSYYGCGAVSAEPQCNVTEENLLEPYPKCCPTIEC